MMPSIVEAAPAPTCTWHVVTPAEIEVLFSEAV
jgi:hypothetical protein